ncbi:hypothetical protein AYI68_g3239 [Smittium mucronatum]|uniref:Endonuclease/exonuclease/phosphatase domain-containing protein n=1 Tax=Smittium mucronatum TaxID=133383 RepID=A0A1R0H0G9_9FUNG|nr:hypothetical protein AYI68_g3239 [Smittium mucronatum]
MDVLAASKFTSKLGVGFELAKVSNSSGLRSNQNAVGRMIDQIFYAGFNCRPNRVIADRKLNISDHMLISDTFNIKGLEFFKIKKKSTLQNRRQLMSN